MCSTRRIAAAILACLQAFGAPAAWADAPCYKGYRDTSAAERATMMRVLESVRRTLPPAPQGWMIVNDDPPSVPGSLCMDAERKPWSYGYSRTFRRTDADKQAEIDAGTRAAADIMQADMAKKQPRLDALQAKSEALVKQQVALIEKGDMAKALALNEQMAVLQEEGRKVTAEGDASERSEAIMKEAMRDIEIGVSVRVNPWSASPPQAGDAAFAADGNPVSARRWNSRNADSFQGGATVIYGQWRTMSQGGLALVVRGHVPANFVHGIVVDVHADERRLSSVIETINFGALSQLVAP